MKWAYMRGVGEKSGEEAESPLRVFFRASPLIDLPGHHFRKEERPRGAKRSRQSDPLAPMVTTKPGWWSRSFLLQQIDVINE